MALNNSHKEFIESTISYVFELSHSENKLRRQIGRINQAILSYNQGEYENFSRVFHDPGLISRIDDCGELTNGQAREYMVEYVGGLIANALQFVEQSPQDLGWNQEEVVKEIRARADHDTNLFSQQCPNARALATENGQQLIAAGLITPQIADQLNTERVAVLVTDEGRQLLEGDQPRLTVQQALQISSEQISVMIQGLSFETVRELTSFQADGVMLGLSAEQVQVNNFGYYTIKGIRTLTARGLPITEAYEKMRGLDDVQIKDILGSDQVSGLSVQQKNGLALGLSAEQVQVDHFGADTIRGIRRLMQRALSLDDAYAKVQGLEDFKINAVLTGSSRDQLDGLNRFQVQDLVDELRADEGQEDSFDLDSDNGISLLSETSIFSHSSQQAICQEGAKMGLTPQQMLALNFGNCTLNAIRQLMERGMSLNDAYAQVQGFREFKINAVLAGFSRDKLIGLNQYQVAGRQMGLDDDEVRVDNFGYHTVKGIRRLKENDGMSLNDAYEQVKGLSGIQVEGVCSGLTHAQVRGLSHPQIEGLQYGLSAEQVRAHNFGHQTLEGIRTLRERGMSLADAYAKLQYLDADRIILIIQGRYREQLLALEDCQVVGLLTGLNFEQILIAEFCNDTSLGIVILIERGMSLVDAYTQLQGLNPAQIDGVLSGLNREQVRRLDNTAQVEGVKIGLRNDQVRVDNFGYHTVRGIHTLMKSDGMSLNDAYEQVQGLTCKQVIMDFLTDNMRLEIDQVIQPDRNRFGLCSSWRGCCLS